MQNNFLYAIICVRISEMKITKDEIKNDTLVRNSKKYKDLISQYDKLQNIYGSKDLNSIYGYGEFNNPHIALVFMNPTKRNIASSKSWNGLRAQWLGTKQIWEFLTKCGLFDQKVNEEIRTKKPNDWTPEFCEYVYKEVKKQKLWITNLAKCTQDDARPLPDKIFLQYKELLKEELQIVNPKNIFFFGNQVSSIMLEQDITVSTNRRKMFSLSIDKNHYTCYTLFYPVGNGRFNQHKAIEDIQQILKNSPR